MDCKATTRQVGAVSIVDLSGRVTLGDGCGIVRDTIRELVEKGEKDILVNLGEVSYIDSAGLGVLVGSYATVTNRGGQVKLLNAQKKVHDLLQITKLYTVFEIFPDETAALASFRRSATA